jgi:hypothetical protein
MKAMLISIFGLTVVDVVCTYWGYKSGYIEEGNPLLRFMFHNHPELTSLLILLFVGCLLALLWNYKDKARHVTMFVVGILVAKIAVVGIHLNWILKITGGF